MSRLRRIVLAVTAVVVLLPLLFIGYLYVSLSGGLDDAFRPKKKASSREVAAARAIGETAVRDQALALGLTIGATRSDCDEGQHNWKIDDDYDLSCTVEADSIARFPLARFRVEALALDDRLVFGGWSPDPQRGLRDVIADARERIPGLMPGAHYRRAGGFQLTVQWADATDRKPRHDLFVDVGEGEFAMVVAFSHVFFKK